jgi:hypothetical protein
LSLHFGTTFVFTVYYFEEAPLIVKIRIFKHDGLTTASISTHDSSERTSLLMLLNLFALQLDLTAFFKQALTTAIRARNNFISTISVDVVVHATTSDRLPAVILAW